MTDMFALLFAAGAFGALLMISDALRTMAGGARLLLGPHGLAAQVHHRMVTIPRSATGLTCPAAGLPSTQRRRATLPNARRVARPALVPAAVRSAAA